MRVLFFILLLLPFASHSQDTTQVFSLPSYLEWVRTYHPMMQQAGLMSNRADAQLLEARGVFDPKLYGEYSDKSFDEKNYFRVGEAGLKVPLWFGADVKFSYLWSNGSFLNPADNLPANGQAIIGLELPVLQGLLFDQRRAQVQKARLFTELNEAERRTMINKLLFSSIESYWQWAFTQQVVTIYQNALNLASDRFQNIKASFIQGDLPAIDTLESLLQIQNRNLALQEAQLDFQKATLELSNFLWYKDLTPLEVGDNLKPEQLNSILNPADTVISENILQNIAQTHPELQSILVKQRQLNIKERLKKEQFKPDLRLNYNFLGNGFDWSEGNPEAGNLNNILLENYKWGVQLNYPLLLRKERAGLELVRIEQLENQLKLSHKELKITNKVSAVRQQIQTVSNQLNTFNNMVINYELLLVAENEKFRIGESSIFLLNSREQKLIEANLKRSKLQVAFKKLQGKLQWALGNLQ